MVSETLSTRMTAMDASFLYFERPSAPLHIGSVSLLDGPLDRATLLAHMESRIHRIPRYRQRAVFDTFNVAHPAWEPDPAFDLGRHVEEVHLAEGADERELRRVIAQLFAPMLPRDRPLWKMLLVQGFQGSTAMVSLVHHCMVDGVSGIELLAAVTDPTRDAPTEEPRPYSPPPPPDPLTRSRAAWSAAIDAWATATADGIKRMMDPGRQMQEAQSIGRAVASATPALLQPAPSTPWNRPVGQKRTFDVIATPFAEIRAVRNVLGGTMNDVVLSTLAGGLGAYLRGVGQRTDGMELRAMVPVNVRPADGVGALGNQVSMYIAPLQVGIVDAKERHLATNARMTALKEAGQADGFSMLSRYSDAAPAWSSALAGLWTPQVQPLFNLVCTNVPGPQIPLYIAGRRLETLWPMLPLSMGLGMGVPLSSYNGVLYWSVWADPELVPDVEHLAACIHGAFEELKAAAAAGAAA